MTILSCKTIFGLTFSAILENLLDSFFSKVPKTVILACLAHLAKIGQNVNCYKKSARAIFYPYIVPRLHAKFQKNRWSGFRDQFVTDIRTSGQG